MSSESYYWTHQDSDMYPVITFTGQKLHPKVSTCILVVIYYSANLKAQQIPQLLNLIYILIGVQ